MAPATSGYRRARSSRAGCFPTSIEVYCRDVHVLYSRMRGGAMQFGLLVQMTGVLGYPQPLARLARAAEAAGWDGFFIWDIFGGDSTAPAPVVDPWIALAAIAATTERIRLGPMVTPLPRSRPWKLAREAASLDHLSGGRLI